MLRQELGSTLDGLLRLPERATRLGELSAVHDASYLAQVHHSRVMARIIEVNSLVWCPRFLMRRWFLNPALWATSGTVLAARQVFQEGLAFNLAGGFHHAKRSWGEGFCLVSDIALAIHTLRAEGAVAADDSIFYVDLDVHQGNGVSTDFGPDPALRILDVFNSQIYPFRDKVARGGIDVSKPLPSGTTDDAYLQAVEEGLAELFAGRPVPKLVIYNAGTDIYKDDLLGDMQVSREGVNRRDLMVLEAVRGRGIPLLVLASGGYSKMSARLISDFVLGAYRYQSSSRF